VARALEKPLAVRDEVRLVIDDQDGSSHSLPSVDEPEQGWCQGQARRKGAAGALDGSPEGEPWGAAAPLRRPMSHPRGRRVWA
jgi:hypothetical protein